MGHLSTESFVQGRNLMALHIVFSHSIVNLKQCFPIKNTKNQFEQVSHWEKASLDYWDNGLLKHLSIGQMYQHPSSLIL